MAITSAGKIRLTGKASHVSGKLDVAQFFRKIQEAAYDGQNGNVVHALDRLALIQALATTALQRLEE